ncbi:CYTOCHROME P450 FAMILY 4 [Salix koriyanagi]|uniref:CYTOCHROME P450 FAMILY 4 n=1 Tax=Salix koriyanagi TaxID=2511006 RepID=A0A9Q0VZ79_9ROSI|nr:CYTOCHROME P450 FAMILY 4 [Salix koriyanagi]
MAANISLLNVPSSSSVRVHKLQIPPFITSSSFSAIQNGGKCKFSSVLACASSNGRKPESVDTGVKKAEKILEQKRRAELSARIASGEFTVQQSGFPSVLRNGLSKLGISNEILDFLFKWAVDLDKDYPKIPEAKGKISAIRSEPFFIPLYELYLTYGGIFRLTFGPKSFLIVSDPSIAKHILKDNPKAYSKGILAEILEFVMGKGLIPADGELWRVRRRAIVPSLHQKYVSAMISLFGEATDRLCKKLDAAFF